MQYTFYYRLGDYQNARYYLNSYEPSSSSEAEFKSLRTIDLDILDAGWNVLADKIPVLENIIGNASNNSNFAISLLNNTEMYKDYLMDTIEQPNVIQSGEIKRIGDDESYLNIYPNPSTDKVFVQLVSNLSNPGKLEILMQREGW
ncbi:MAG: hypothetical protein R2764_00790 [Bacteroidales bacterium]